jgi:16S rRNA (cytosine1402-N4)-methyltransferase
VTLPHRTVLLHEAIDALVTDVDGTYVDATFGRGGHSRLLLSRLSTRARLIALDRDPEAVAAAQQDAQRAEGPLFSPWLPDPRCRILHANFADLRDALATMGVTRIQGLLLDLGVSSPQLDDPARGFSFRFDAPLDMRMDPTRGRSAADFLARADERQLAEVIKDYGEERFARQIAKALVARREGGRPVRTTAELSQLVAGAVRTREAGQDPATRTFQALRIFVNAELEALDQVLSQSLDLLACGARLAVISFHSLEDRRVKGFIARESREVVDRRAPFAPAKPLRLKAIARIKPSADEIAANPRARSAVLRVAERTGA